MNEASSSSAPKADAHPLPTQEIKRAWRIVTAAGSLATIYGVLCLYGVPRTKYLTELGATASHFGYIAASASIAVLFQIVAGVWASHLRHRRPFFVILVLFFRICKMESSFFSPKVSPIEVERYCNETKSRNIPGQKEFESLLHFFIDPWKRI